MLEENDKPKDMICQFDNLSKTIVAAFDFDGTITTRDSLLELLRFNQGNIKFILNIIPEIPFFLLYLIGLYTRQQIKERLLTRFFQGVPYGDFQSICETFVQERLDAIVRPEALRRIKWHLNHKHRLILISANLDTYLSPWAKRHGFEIAICSRVATDQGVISGKLDGMNCWGQEKATRLLNYLGPKETFILYGYGDSKGDKELLALSDFACYVNSHSSFEICNDYDG